MRTRSTVGNCSNVRRTCRPMSSSRAGHPSSRPHPGGAVADRQVCESGDPAGEEVQPAADLWLRRSSLEPPRPRRRPARPPTHRPASSVATLRTSLLVASKPRRPPTGRSASAPRPGPDPRATQHRGVAPTGKAARPGIPSPAACVSWGGTRPSTGRQHSPLPDQPAWTAVALRVRAGRLMPTAASTSNAPQRIALRALAGACGAPSPGPDGSRSRHRSDSRSVAGQFAASKAARISFGTRPRSRTR